MTKVPQGPWYNPDLEERAYKAVIQDIHDSVYGKQRNTYIQIVFWLPNIEMYFVTNIYLPTDQPEHRSVHRLYGLCKCIGRIPQDVLDAPASFKGEELQITVKKMKGVGGNGGNEYCDVDLFLPADFEPAAVMLTV